MPLIYRAMKKAEDDMPAAGRSSTTLGVRVPLDILPDGNGDVRPGRGGMSVSPSLVTLPPHLIPRRLRALAPDADGKNHIHVWKVGEGPFIPGAVAAGLLLQPDSIDHGTVQPDTPMRLQAYEDALTATRAQWVIDETGA